MHSDSKTNLAALPGAISGFNKHRLGHSLSLYAGHYATLMDSHELLYSNKITASVENLGFTAAAAASITFSCHELRVHT